MNLKSLSRIQNLMNMKMEQDVAVFSEKKRLLAVEERRKKDLLEEIKEIQNTTNTDEIWAHTRLAKWLAYMQQKLQEVDREILKRQDDLEEARQALLQSNGKLKGIEHLLEKPKS